MRFRALKIPIKPVDSKEHLNNIPIIKNFPSSIPLFNLKIAQIKIIDKIKKVEKINGYQMVFIPKFTLNC